MAEIKEAVNTHIGRLTRDDGQELPRVLLLMTMSHNSDPTTCLYHLMKTTGSGQNIHTIQYSICP